MKLRIITVFVLVLGILCFSFASPALAATPKNETVYAMLNHDGSVDKIHVVNQLIGEYVDYGEYTDIKNLSTLSEPTIDGDKITFPDETVEGGLYYQGTMEGELPIVFDIKYYLDGQLVSAENIGGQSGHLKMEIGYAVNQRCNERVRDGYMAQISMMLHHDTASNIDAYEAVTVVVGNTMNISYTILPGENGTMHLTADINDFEMDAISITLLKGTLSGFEESINEVQGGFDDLLDGANDMVDGTSELKDGVSSLEKGVGDLKYGIYKLKSSGEDMLVGMEQYAGGLNEYTIGVEDIAVASSQIQVGIDELSSNGTSVAGGITDINNGISALSASGTDLMALAQSLLSNPDPSVQALANGVIESQGALSQLSAGLEQASQGVTDYTGGVQQTANSYQAFNEGIGVLAAKSAQVFGGYSEIKGGFESYLSGISSSAYGMHKLYKAIEELPEGVQELIDGQIEFKEGIATAKDDISNQTQNFISDDSPAVSFASSNKNHPNSVQYILMTPTIVIPKENIQTETIEVQENFFTRLADLFR